MSKKVTFGELIEAIAEETDHSKQFTHDFIKDFVDVIHGGLEKDGKVNIAGFGKFKLKRVDERDGYNPQTEEKITIPAHNKIVFKPYKDFRELVNAPYAHIEPELIDEDSSDQIREGEQESAEEDFIPTGPSTQHESAPAQEHEEDISDDNGDIVEFDGQRSEDNEADQELDEFIGANQSDEEEEQDSVKTSASEATSSEKKEEQLKQSAESNDETSDEPELKDQSSEVEKHPTPSPTFGEHSSGRRNATSIPMGVIAAAFILLLAVGSTLYFSAFSSEDSPQMSAKKSVQTANNTDQQTPTNQQQQDQATANRSAATQEPSADQSEKQQTQKSAETSQAQSGQSTAEATSTEEDSQSMNIQRGQTLWSIAEEKYGNPRLWPWIYGTNDRLANPNNILAGNSLAVPLPSGADNNLNSADSVGVAKGFLATYNWYKNKNSEKAKNHLWGAKLYHNNLRNIADIKINQADLKFANRAR